MEEAESAMVEVPITKCGTCVDIADKGFEVGPGELGEVAVEFLNHIIQNHTEELLSILTERYLPIFMMKRANR